MLKLPKSIIKVTLNCGIEKVWGIVTSLSDYTWRSDISKIDIIEEDRVFIEYTKDLYPTTFTITRFVPLKRYEFKMDNSNMTGYWTGIFKRTDHAAEIEFTEDVTAKKFYLRPFVKMYLKRQQAAYIRDLMKKLDE